MSIEMKNPSAKLVLGQTCASRDPPHKQRGPVDSGQRPTVPDLQNTAGLHEQDPPTRSAQTLLQRLVPEIERQRQSSKAQPPSQWRKYPRENKVTGQGPRHPRQNYQLRPRPVRDPLLHSTMAKPPRELVHNAESILKQVHLKVAFLHLAPSPREKHSAPLVKASWASWDTFPPDGRLHT